MKQIFLKLESEWMSAMLYGSQARVTSGGRAILQAPLDCNKDWFAGESTVILGIREPSPGDGGAEPTVAEWHIPIDPGRVAQVESGFLIIAAERGFGGLHTQRRGALARIAVNGHSRDIVGLQHVPDGHTDYFHLVRLPELPKIWPIVGCSTVYAWIIHRPQLRSDGNQIVRVEIDAGVLWDIDYVMLALNVQSSRIRPWIAQVAYVVLGVVLGNVRSFL